MQRMDLLHEIDELLELRLVELQKFSARGGEDAAAGIGDRSRADEVTPVAPHVARLDDELDADDERALERNRQLDGDALSVDALGAGQAGDLVEQAAGD